MNNDIAVFKIQFLKALDGLIEYHLSVRDRYLLKQKADTMSGSKNWLGFLIQALSQVPVVVAGIEAIHGDAKAGADKKALAMESLGFASAVGQVMDPAHAQAMQIAQGVISNAIDGTVAVMNAANAGAKPSPITPPPAPAPAIEKVHVPIPEGQEDQPASKALRAQAQGDSGRSVFGAE